MIYPFVVFALPRSRTTWLSHFLSYGGLAVGHDLGPQADTCQQFFDSLWPLAGTCETGAQDVAPLIRQAMPTAKFAVIKRPVDQVERSLAAFGETGHRAELERRSAVIDSIEGLHISYESLADARTCCQLWEHLLPTVPFDFQWWRYMDRLNVQTDVPGQLQFVAERRAEIARLKAEFANLDTKIHRIEWEPVMSWWPDAQELLANHSVEVNAGVRHGHPYKMNITLLQSMEQIGTLRIMTARVNGTLKGYCTWTFLDDVESEGVLVADQGAWYISPDAPGLGRKILDKSIAEVKALGIQSVQLHHQLNGRGARLGKMFQRMGAIELQHRYSLWIGD